MRRLSRFLMLIPLALGLSGCAYLYHPENDKAAQQAKKAFEDANIGGALDAERKLLLAHQQERQQLVKQAQLALRDVSLSNTIKKPDNAAAATALDQAIQLRIKRIAGAAEITQIESCPRQIKAAKSTLDTVKTDWELAVADANIALAKTSAKVRWDCKALPTKLPPALASDFTLASLAVDHDAVCARVNKAEACLKAFDAPGGELSDVAAELGIIAAEKKFVAEQVQASDAEYKAALKEVDDAQPVAGAAQKAAETLRKALDNIAAAPVKQSSLAADPILKHIYDAGQVEALTKKKEILDAYLAALGGSEPKNGPATQYRLYLVANLVNRATAKTPPTAGIIMQSEYYRLQIQALRARIARTDAAAALLEKKHDALLYEFGDLQEAKANLATAKCATQGQAQPGAPENAAATCKHYLARALRAYATSWTGGRLHSEQIDYQLIEQNEIAALDESQTALQQTDLVVKAALEQVANLHAAGVKPEQISNFWQAVGLAAIAIRVK